MGKAERESSSSALDVDLREQLLPDSSSEQYDQEERVAYLRQKSPSLLSSFDSDNAEVVFSIADSDDGLTIKRYPTEYRKTLHAFLFCLCGFFTSNLILAHVEESGSPDLVPLPDVVFNFAPLPETQLELSEYIMMILVYPIAVLLLLHRYRSLIFRRVFLLMGVLHICRALFLVVTVLPQATTKPSCAAQANNTSYLVIVHRLLFMLSGLGISVNGELFACGEFVYSGHICTLIMCCLVFAEYTPQDNPLFLMCKWIIYMFAAVGVILISYSRSDYTIDILIAYVMTTTLFRLYHTIAAHSQLKIRSDTNQLSHIWWFRLVQYFEENVSEGKVPYQCSEIFVFPLPLKRVLTGQDSIKIPKLNIFV